MSRLFFLWSDTLRNVRSVQRRVFHEHQCESQEIPLAHCRLASFSCVSPVFRPGPFRLCLIPHASSIVSPPFMLPSRMAAIVHHHIQCICISPPYRVPSCTGLIQGLQYRIWSTVMCPNHSSPETFSDNLREKGQLRLVPPHI